MTRRQSEAISTEVSIAWDFASRSLREKHELSVSKILVRIIFSCFTVRKLSQIKMWPIYLQGQIWRWRGLWQLRVRRCGDGADDCAVRLQSRYFDCEVGGWVDAGVLGGPWNILSSVLTRDTSRSRSSDHQSRECHRFNLLLPLTSLGDDPQPPNLIYKFYEKP